MNGFPQMRPILPAQVSVFLRILYTSSFLFSFHAALTSYIESSFLATFVSENIVGIMFILGSITAFFGLFWMPWLLHRYGNYRVTLTLVILEILTLIGLSMVTVHALLLVIFILHLATYPLLIFTMDIFLESSSSDTTTGRTRGVYLTTQNAAWIAPPLIAGLILTDGDYWKIFTSAAVILSPVLILVFLKLYDFRDPNYSHVSFFDMLKEVRARKDIYRIFMSNLLLSFFFSWMVIYTPIYLHTYLKIAWSDIGLIFTIMLVPFVLLSIPLGKLSDTHLGEKEILSYGFIITAITTAVLSFVASTSIALWAALLFLTRIGATMIQIMNESYFFKQIDAADANLISVFRYTYPLGYVIGPLAASIVLSFIEFRFIFLVLGIIMLYGLRYSLTIKDTE